MSEREKIERALKRANETMPGIAVPAANGDNLAVVLCSFFDDGEDDGHESGWSNAALEGERQMIDAIREHYSGAILAALVSKD